MISLFPIVQDKLLLPIDMIIAVALIAIIDVVKLHENIRENQCLDIDVNYS